MARSADRKERPARAPRPPRGLSEADRTTRSEYARLVRPLAGRALPDPPAVPPAPPPEAQAPPTPPPRPRPQGNPALVVGDAPAGLDKASWKRLRAGKLAPGRVLDLHGQTTQRAFHALEAFLHAAVRDRLRCVEVVTGRGSGEGGGAIRREFPFWLNLPNLRPLILGASYPHEANIGAVRLLLRRAGR